MCNANDFSFVLLFLSLCFFVFYVFRCFADAIADLVGGMQRSYKEDMAVINRNLKTMNGCVDAVQERRYIDVIVNRQLFARFRPQLDEMVKVMNVRIPNMAVIFFHCMDDSR